MAKPKITRLSDPNNPYGGKKTPTRERTAAEKLDAISRSRAQPERREPAKPKAKPPVTGPLGRARMQVIDDAIEGRTRRKK